MNVETREHRTGLGGWPLWHWWVDGVTASIDHKAIVEKVYEDADHNPPDIFAGSIGGVVDGFSAAQRQAYQAVLGRTLNDSAFRRKIDELRVVEPVIGSASKVSARPAQLYRLSHPSVVEFDRTL